MGTALRFLDHNVSWAGDRSVRELIAIAGGLALCTYEFVDPRGVDVGNLIVYVLATGLFALRVYFARAAAVGACVGALAQQWPHLRGDITGGDLETYGVFPLLAIALLASSDLVERFERSPARHRWIPNAWAQFTAAQTRVIRWSVYAAGALGGLLDHMIQLSTRFGELGVWPRASMIAIIAFAALLVLGRAIGLVGLWLTALVVAVQLAPHAWLFEQQLAAGEVSEAARVFFSARFYLLPALLLAVFTVVTATPYTLRLLRRSLFARA
ncbi:MAG: hypothetical protein R3A51_01540 [Nannocystaceae bacterium]|nr:hypothetical protein [Myxococcales bacterium]